MRPIALLLLALLVVGCGASSSEAPTQAPTGKPEDHYGSSKG